MMKIKLTDLNDWSNRPYLKQNSEFANQLVTTLNQVNGFSPNELAFAADSCYWTYDYWFSPNYEIEKWAFAIVNDQIKIRSTNRDDLLNPHYYQHLNHLANNYSIKEQRWSYYAQDQVLQLESFYWSNSYLNIKLTKPIDQYNQNQLNAMGKLITNVYNLVIKDDELDWKQFANQWKPEFINDRSVGILFDLNDFANPKLLIRWWDENDGNQYENNDLKQVLKSDAPLLKFLNNNDFQTNFLNDRTKTIKSLKDF